MKRFAHILVFAATSMGTSFAQDAWFGSPPTSGTNSSLMFRPSNNLATPTYTTTPVNQLIFDPPAASGGTGKGFAYANTGSWQTLWQDPFTVTPVDGITGTTNYIEASVGNLFASGSVTSTGLNGTTSNEKMTGSFTTIFSTGWWVGATSGSYYVQSPTFTSGRLTNTTLLGSAFSASGLTSASFRVWYVPQDAFQQYTYDTNTRDYSYDYGATPLGTHSLSGLINSANTYDWNGYVWAPSVTNWDTLPSNDPRVYWTTVTLYKTTYNSSWYLFKALGTQGLVIPSGGMISQADTTLTAGYPGGEDVAQNYTALTFEAFDVRPVAYNAGAAHAIVQLSDGTDPASIGGVTVTIQDSLGNTYFNETTGDEFVAAAVNPDSLGDGAAPTGTYQVTISVPGYTPYTTSTTLTNGGAYTDLGTVTLSP